MSFQWLTIRIGEEKDRRAREAQILQMLPEALEELRGHLGLCVDAYNDAFGEGAARIEKGPDSLKVATASTEVDVVTDTELPGFHIRRQAASEAIQVGVLPGGRPFYFDVAADQYLTTEDLTRRVLDRVLFPRLKE